MGALTSSTNWEGHNLNGVVLGQPVETDDGYVWDDSRIPSGVIDDDGNIVADDVELM
jgi:hypothetical protein